MCLYLCLKDIHCRCLAYVQSQAVPECWCINRKMPPTSRLEWQNDMHIQKQQGMLVLDLKVAFWKLVSSYKNNYSWWCVFCIAWSLIRRCNCWNWSTNNLWNKSENFKLVFVLKGNCSLQLCTFWSRKVIIFLTYWILNSLSYVKFWIKWLFARWGCWSFS